MDVGEEVQVKGRADLQCSPELHRFLTRFQFHHKPAPDAGQVREGLLAQLLVSSLKADQRAKRVRGCDENLARHVSCGRR